MSSVCPEIDFDRSDDAEPFEVQDQGVADMLLEQALANGTGTTAYNECMLAYWNVRGMDEGDSDARRQLLSYQAIMERERLVEFFN